MLLILVMPWVSELAVVNWSLHGPDKGAILVVTHVFHHFQSEAGETVQAFGRAQHPHLADADLGKELRPDAVSAQGGPRRRRRAPTPFGFEPVIAHAREHVADFVGLAQRHDHAALFPADARPRRAARPQGGKARA